MTYDKQPTPTNYRIENQKKREKSRSRSREERQAQLVKLEKIKELQEKDIEILNSRKKEELADLKALERQRLERDTLLLNGNGNGNGSHKNKNNKNVVDSVLSENVIMPVQSQSQLQPSQAQQAQHHPSKNVRSSVSPLKKGYSGRLTHTDKLK
eukprot:CAMPEP_0116943166 /NCGR_PEP_ID=MMETSP0467-20121206/35032_1 /TAXON_ID=283647 /ORGANISM="Mesodinium pulex, Strain SPMC105" /LENGTH=153 /DNA_ID=CAMNT_0004626309 /DNA_START=341 /DNA_END=802 /DNA_ORIENTATION=+